MIVMTVVGARPQFIKAAVVSRALADATVEEALVHTGQHYDVDMSDVFFRELGIREPTFNLAVGSGSHAEQTGRMLVELERVMQQIAPQRVLVYGDTNSTLAGALAAAKLAIPVDHVEAGLRAFDRDMPEELNRTVADQLSDQLFCPTARAVANLRREGIVDGVTLTGDVMLDLALQMRQAALRTPLPEGLREGAYFVATIHRASNTDDTSRLRAILVALDEVSRLIAPVILPVHPRLALGARRTGAIAPSLRTVPPVGYLEMQGLILRSRGVITDSGGVQKEALFHGKMCLTLRDSTEWVEGVEAGLNVLVGSDLSSLKDHAAACDPTPATSAAVLAQFGGGQAAQRIARAVKEKGADRRRWTLALEPETYIER